LLEPWENLLVAISGGAIELKMDSLVDTFLKEKINKFMDNGSKNTLHVQGRPKEKGGQKNVDKDKSKSKGRSKNPRQIRLKCLNCEKWVHLRKECRNKKKILIPLLINPLMMMLLIHYLFLLPLLVMTHG